MAKYLGDPASGSTAGITYSRNRYGQYRRTRATPINPNTSSQATQRSHFTNASQDWRGLSTAQRLSWASYADSHPVVNSLGVPVVLSPNAMFCKIRLQQRAAGVSVTDVPPVDGEYSIANVTIAAAVTGPVFTISGPNQATGYVGVVRASALLSPGVTYAPTLKQIAKVAADAWATPIDIAAAYSAFFGSLVEGKKIIVECQLASDEGHYGPKPSNSLIVGA